MFCAKKLSRPKSRQKTKPRTGPWSRASHQKSIQRGFILPSPPEEFKTALILSEISTLRMEAETLPGGPAHPDGGFDLEVSLVLDKLVEIEERVREVRP